MNQVHRIRFVTFAAGEISLRDAYCAYLKLDATECIIFTELKRGGSMNQVHRIRFVTFAAGEISLRDAYCAYLIFQNCELTIHDIYSTTHIFKCQVLIKKTCPDACIF